MSEVISQREQVAQAELAARVLKLPPEREVMTEPLQKVNGREH
jgi:hypothetical protein